jgi:hypothetical protein
LTEADERREDRIAGKRIFTEKKVEAVKELRNEILQRRGDGDREAANKELVDRLSHMSDPPIRAAAADAILKVEKYKIKAGGQAQPRFVDAGVQANRRARIVAEVPLYHLATEFQKAMTVVGAPVEPAPPLASPNPNSTRQRANFSAPGYSVGITVNTVVGGPNGADRNGVQLEASKASGIPPREVVVLTLPTAGRLAPLTGAGAPPAHLRWRQGALFTPRVFR